MKLIKTTPVPNILFDQLLPELSASSLKILLVIIRQTIGWTDAKSRTGRKDRDWISSSQLHKKSGCSIRSISTAVTELVKLKIIEVYDTSGNSLLESKDRKGKSKLFFKLQNSFVESGDNWCKSPCNPVKFEISSAKNAEFLRKRVTELAQNLRITKETLQK